MVQPLHEIHAVRIHLDSAELLAYAALTHRGEIRIQEGIPLRPDEEQVGLELEDLEVLEVLDPEYYILHANHLLACVPDRWVVEKAVVSITTKRHHGCTAVVIQSVYRQGSFPFGIVDAAATYA